MNRKCGTIAKSSLLPSSEHGRTVGNRYEDIVLSRRVVPTIQSDVCEVFIICLRNRVPSPTYNRSTLWERTRELQILHAIHPSSSTDLSSGLHKNANNRWQDDLNMVETNISDVVWLLLRRRAIHSDMSNVTSNTFETSGPCDWH